jgi:periplasmic divalent cation tolerance protein
VNQSNDIEMPPGYAGDRSQSLVTGHFMSTQMNTDTLILLCTCPDEAVAADLSTRLVEQGLAACINRFPGLTSVYKWEGEMKSGTEVQLVIKTSASAVDNLIDELQQLHPYELPEIIAVPITAGYGPYLDWIRESTS